MAGILIPVIVHLWNDRRGKVLRIGSIALLTGSSRRLAWSRRLTQRVLLALRCLLAAALALLLAGPYWTRRAEGKKGWVLVAGAGGQYRVMIDSLVRAGYREQALDSSGNYWEAFRHADKLAPAGTPFFVFTPGLADRFDGVRPVTGRMVHWQVYAPADKASRWVEAAWRITVDSITVLTGVSRSTATEWKKTTAGSRTGQYEGVKVDEAPMSIVVHTDDAYRQDGKYLVAALKALAAVTGRKMRIASGGAGGDWLFWLSARPLPPVTGFLHVWCYGQGKVETVDTWMEGTDLKKEIAGGRGEAVWKDGYGRGILVRDSGIYRYYSRLDPAWGGLVWSAKLPVLLGELLMERREAGARDRRVLDPGQVEPVFREEAAANAGEDSGERIDWRPAAWAIVFILFVLERIKAFHDGGRKA